MFYVAEKKEICWRPHMDDFIVGITLILNKCVVSVKMYACNNISVGERILTKFCKENHG
jgi:hypothetical protein